MGIRKYYNKWRCYIVDKKGIKHQEYFETKEEAQTFYDEMYKGKVPHACYKKKSDAKHQDLPVGLHEREVTRPLKNGGESVDHFIKAVVMIDGKPVSKERVYGVKRTREKAVEFCHKWRLMMIKTMIK